MTPATRQTLIGVAVGGVLGAPLTLLWGVSLYGGGSSGYTFPTGESTGTAEWYWEDGDGDEWLVGVTFVRVEPSGQTSESAVMFKQPESSVPDETWDTSLSGVNAYPTGNIPLAAGDARSNVFARPYKRYTGYKSPTVCDTDDGACFRTHDAFRTYVLDEVERRFGMDTTNRSGPLHDADSTTFVDSPGWSELDLSGGDTACEAELTASKPSGYSDRARSETFSGGIGFLDFNGWTHLGTWTAPDTTYQVVHHVVRKSKKHYPHTGMTRRTNPLGGATTQNFDAWKDEVCASNHCAKDGDCVLSVMKLALEDSW